MMQASKQETDLWRGFALFLWQVSVCKVERFLFGIWQDLGKIVWEQNPKCQGLTSEIAYLIFHTEPEMFVETLVRFWPIYSNTKTRRPEFLATIKEKSKSIYTITLFWNFFETVKNVTSKATKMKFLIVFALVIVAALAAPPTGDVTLLKNDFSNDGTAGYNFAWVTKQQCIN